MLLSRLAARIARFRVYFQLLPAASSTPAGIGDLTNMPALAALASRCGLAHFRCTRLAKEVRLSAEMLRADPAGQGRAGQGRTGQNRAGQNRAGAEQGQGKARAGEGQGPVKGKCKARAMGRSGLGSVKTIP